MCHSVNAKMKLATGFILNMQDWLRFQNDDTGNSLIIDLYHSHACLQNMKLR